MRKAAKRPSHTILFGLRVLQEEEKLVSEEPKPTRTLMYLGTEPTYGKGNIPKATNSRWLRLDGIENDGRALSDIINPTEQVERECLYSKQLGQGRGRPGAIWVFEAAEQAKIYPSTGRCIGRWKNDADVIRWQAKEEAIRKEIMLATRAAQQIKENLPMEALKPFRQAWWGLTTRQQGILLAQVMVYIMGSSSRSDD